MISGTWNLVIDTTWWFSKCELFILLFPQSSPQKVKVSLHFIMTDFSINLFLPLGLHRMFLACSTWQPLESCWPRVFSSLPWDRYWTSSKLLTILVPLWITPFCLCPLTSWTVLEMKTVLVLTDPGLWASDREWQKQFRLWTRLRYKELYRLFGKPRGFQVSPWDGNWRIHCEEFRSELRQTRPVPIHYLFSSYLFFF